MPKAQSTELLYRMTEHGATARDFHSRCDLRGSTLTLAQISDTTIVGGFTDVPWTSPVNWEMKNSFNTWLFRVNGNIVTKCPIIKGENQYAVAHRAINGPSFGSGRDVCLSFESGESHSNAGNTYVIP